jgi:hypothetical protein
MLALAAHCRQPAGVIAVFVRDQYRVQLVQILADRGQTLSDFTAAETGIDQYTRPPSGDEGRIAAAAAR